MSRARGWFLTENRNIEDSKSALSKICDEGGVRYAVMAKERAPTTGHEHAHIYLYFTCLKSFKAIKEVFPTADIERAKGNMEQASKYVTKDGDVLYEFGDLPKPSKSIDEQWKEAVEAFKNGKGDKESRMYARYQRFFDNLETTYAELKDFDGDLKKKNLWIYGDPGTGKSRSVREYARLHGLRIYNKLPNKWWDGFEGQDIVLFEDADADTCRILIRQFKLWTDRYVFAAELKGSRKDISPNFQFIITSNHDLEECFPEGIDEVAIRRRFSVLSVGDARLHGSDLDRYLRIPNRPANGGCDSSSTGSGELGNDNGGGSLCTGNSE